MLNLRSVIAEDRKIIWEWANDPITRAASFSSAPIPWNEHIRWFAGKLADPNCQFFMILDAHDCPIGQIRYDIEEREAVVSIALASSQRGQGYGRQVLCKASQGIFENTAVELIHAYIKPDNVRSIHVFSSAGFINEGLSKLQEYPAFDFILLKKTENIR